MRSVLFLVAALIVMGLAFWAYRENYRTQAALDGMGTVQGQIAGLREDLGVLRAEWAFLNRPERLRQLVELNFDKLELMPLGADQFVPSGAIAYAGPKAAAALDGPAPNDPSAPGDPAALGDPGAPADPGAEASPDTDPGADAGGMDAPGADSAPDTDADPAAPTPPSTEEPLP